MRLRSTTLSTIGATAIAVASWTGSGAGAPLDFPVPSEIGLDDLLSTSGESGDARGIVPGVRACDSAPRRQISLPADDTPHDDSWIEWWWWYGHLVAGDGRRFGFLLFFPSKPTAHFYAVEYAITDLSTGEFHYGRQPFIPGWPQTTANGYLLRDDHARAAGGDGRDQLHLEVDGYELDLSVEATKPPVAEAGDGNVRGYCNDAYLFFRERMSVRGTLKQAGTSIPVTGTSTFSRAWGFDVVVDFLAWDWVTLELDDGRDVFLIVAALRKNGEEFTVKLGSISDTAGNVTALHRGDFTLTPTRFWQRGATCAYPVDWDVQLPGLSLHASALLDAAEVRGTRWPAAYVLWPNWPLYWDGPAVVSGDATGRAWYDLGHYCEF